MQNKRYSTLIFDLDGTLVDSFYEIYDTLKKTCLFFCIEPLSRALTQSFIGPGAEHLLRAAIGEHPIELSVFRQKFNSFYHDGQLEKTPLFEGVLDVLGSLKDQQFSLNILSNKPYDSILILLKQLGIVSYFDIIVGPETTGYPKPAIEGMMHVVDLCQADVSSCLFVGDTHTDLLTAQKAGVDALLVAYGYGDELVLKTEFELLGVLDSLGDIFTYL